MRFRRLDFLYLVRSGLGIPDYWHPHLKVQDDFKFGKIARYPLSMDAKADYPGQLNGENVPLVCLDTMISPSPATVILYGLGSHDVFLKTGDERYRRQMMHAVQWLKNHSVSLGDGISWPYPEDLPVYGLKSPWYSAVVQGFALSLLIRVSQLDVQGPWRHMAQQTWSAYHVPIKAGGFCRATTDGTVYEEYPASELNFVFNGMCFALIGLWEAHRSRIAPTAERDFNDGVRALRAALGSFNQGGWSLYSLSRRLGKPLLASPYYHRANGLLAQVIAWMSDDPEFSACGERWLKSGRSVARRAAMSLRIGMDRFIYAPALLQRDKATSG